MNTKKCSKCKIEKNISEFHRLRKNDNTRFKSQCKNCANETTRLWKHKNKDKILKYREENKDKAEKYRKEHKTELNEYFKKRYQEKKHIINKRINDRIRDNLELRLLRNYRCRINKALKYNIKSVGTRKLIGCTQEELISHLEKQFTPEMNWDNYGPYFHIDHIIPCSAWDLTNDFELKACFHYTNLQPLVGPENQSKGDKYCEKEKKIHFDKIKNLILNTE